MSKKIKVEKHTKTYFKEVDSFGGVSLDEVIKALQTIRDEVGEDCFLNLNKIGADESMGVRKIEIIEFCPATYNAFINFRENN